VKSPSFINNKSFLATLALDRTIPCSDSRPFDTLASALIAQLVLRYDITQSEV